MIISKFTQHFIYQFLLLSIIPLGLIAVTYGFFQLDFMVSLIITLVFLVPLWIWNMNKLEYYDQSEHDIAFKKELQADNKRLGINNEATE